MPDRQLSGQSIPSGGTSWAKVWRWEGAQHIQGIVKRRAEIIGDEVRERKGQKITISSFIQQLRIQHLPCGAPGG